MRRILLLVTVAVVMAAMVLVAGPALAAPGSQGDEHRTTIEAGQKGMEAASQAGQQAAQAANQSAQRGARGAEQKAQERGVDLSQVQGSGAEGRITVRDVTQEGG